MNIYKRFIYCLLYLIYMFIGFIGTVYISASYDVTFIGPLKFADGIARLPIVWIEALKNKMSINYISTGMLDVTDVSNAVRAIVHNSDKRPGKVALFFDLPWTVSSCAAMAVPCECTIKLAYSMFEANQIPRQWVDIFNQKFDGIIVPDRWLVKIYEQSGVKIPIFVAPCALDLEEFLAVPLKKWLVKKRVRKSFTFGMSAGFWTRKNHCLLVDAFIQEFGNNAHIKLKFHSRMGCSYIEEELKAKIASAQATNIKIINKSFTKKEYRRWMTSLDCYVLLSTAEGFSITPREALCLGIPVIISANTAQKTICDTGMVRAVITPLLESHYDSALGGFCGYVYNCTIQEACEALRDVYKNHEYYVQKAKNGRKWVKQYTCKNLSNLYATFIKPHNVVLGHKNSVKPGILTTTSKSLYNKYRTLLTR